MATRRWDRLSEGSRRREAPRAGVVFLHAVSSPPPPCDLHRAPTPAHEHPAHAHAPPLRCTTLAPRLLAFCRRRTLESVFFYGCARCVPGPSPSPAHARPTVASTIAQAAVRSPQPLRPPAPPLQPPSPYLRPLARSHAQGSFCAMCTGEEGPPHDLRRADDPPTASRRRLPHHTPSHPLSHHSHTPFYPYPPSQLPPPSSLRASRHPSPLHPRTSLPVVVPRVWGGIVASLCLI